MQTHDLTQDDSRGIGERVEQWRYGVIESRNGEVVRIYGRWLPKWISYYGVWWGNQVVHRCRDGDRFRLYYDQPLFHSKYLALKYIESYSQTSLATIFSALKMLDQIAELKRADAILAEVKNPRLTARVMERFGWVKHLEHVSDRHYIRRFYGQYGM